MTTDRLYRFTKKDLLVSLETHNAANFLLYHHYRFHLYQALQSHFDLTQYCLVRAPGGKKAPHMPTAPKP